MKKARISLGKGVKSWSFFIYDSSESAFYLKDLGADEDFDEEYRRLVVLERSDLVEAEWMGSEWVYHEELGRSERYDTLRLAKIVTKETTEATGYVEIYSGWVSADLFDWTGKNSKSKDVVITPIKGRMKHRLDFSKIFPDDQDEPEEPPEVLN